MVDFEELATVLYEMSQDMDSLDYEETKEKEIMDLVRDLEILKAHGRGTLLSALETIAETYEGGCHD